MVWPIIRGESYVAETGKSMKACRVGGISRGLLVKNRDINNSPSPACLLAAAMDWWDNWTASRRRRNDGSAFG
jgi:hypothetical protein